MPVCDARYSFTLFDIGSSGRHSDGGVLAHSAFGQVMERGEIKLPPPCPLPGTDTVAPHVILGDAPFPLRVDLMRPLATTYRRIRRYSIIAFHEHVESLRIRSGFSLSVGESFADPSWRNQITSMLLSKRQSASTIFCDSQISQSSRHSDIALLALPTQKTWVVT